MTGVHSRSFHCFLRTFAVAFLFSSTATCGADAQKREVKLPTSRWSDVETAMGNVKLDGTLRLRYPISEHPSLRLLGIRPVLEHCVDSDADGNPVSRWDIAALHSSLVPRGRKHLLWRPPGRATVIFERDKIGRALSNAGATEWKIRETTPDTFEIRALDGRAWRYANGLLVAAEHPSLGQVQFFTKGGLIREVRLNSGGLAGSETPILKAIYDASARLKELCIEKSGRHHFTWNPAGELVEWRRADGKVIRFGYRLGLLIRMAVGDELIREFRWAENAGSCRGDSRWPAAIHLAADETSTYRFNLSRKGYQLTRYENISGRVITTIFNPRRYRLEQYAGEEALIVSFRKDKTKRGVVERIENREGELLEYYEFDDQGHLVRSKGNGDLERSLRYDETGRLMALEEKSEP